MSPTVGISRALGDPKKTAGYMADGDLGKLARRLVSDAKHLAAYYAYGAMHCAVRLRWGFLARQFYVSWDLPGDPLAHDVLRQAHLDKAPVDVVLGWSAPGWEEPWSRARRCTVTRVDPDWVTFLAGQESVGVPMAEVQAVRRSSR